MQCRNATHLAVCEAPELGQERLDIVLGLLCLRIEPSKAANVPVLHQELHDVDIVLQERDTPQDSDQIYSKQDHTQSSQPTAYPPLGLFGCEWLSILPMQKMSYVR